MTSTKPEVDSSTSLVHNSVVNKNYSGNGDVSAAGTQSAAPPPRQWQIAFTDGDDYDVVRPVQPGTTCVQMDVYADHDGVELPDVYKSTYVDDPVEQETAANETPRPRPNSPQPSEALVTVDDPTHPSATPTRSSTTRPLLIRRESDLDLLLLPPPANRGRRHKLMQKLRRCCRCDCIPAPPCSLETYPKWKRVVILVVGAIGLALLYVVIVVAIWKGIGS